MLPLQPKNPNNKLKEYNKTTAEVNEVTAQVSKPNPWNKDKGSNHGTSATQRQGLCFTCKSPNHAAQSYPYLWFTCKSPNHHAQSYPYRAEFQVMLAKRTVTDQPIIITMPEKKHSEAIVKMVLTVATCSRAPKVKLWDKNREPVKGKTLNQWKKERPCRNPWLKPYGSCNKTSCIW